MTNRERLALAKRVQKNLQKKLPHYKIIARREKIEEAFKSAKKKV